MLYFYFKEALKSIGRAKTSFFFSIISMMIAVFMLAGSAGMMLISNKFEKEISEKITLHLFISENNSVQSSDKIKNKIISFDFINSITFISKEKAAEIFVEKTGEDFRSILDANPLPASFDVTLKEHYFHNDSINKAVSLLEKLDGIDEVVFQESFVLRILSVFSQIKLYVYILTLIILLISGYIVYSTSRLVLNLKKNEIETMKLVGATLSSIKIPIILNGLLVGIIAGIINSIIFISIYYFFNTLYLNKIIHSTQIAFIPIIFLTIGIIISMLSTSLVVRKITLRV